MKHHFVLLGLSGKKTHGKSSAANYLCEKYGFVQLAFADPIKQVIGKQIFFLSDEQLNGTLKDVPDVRWNKTPREIIIKASESMKEYMGDDVWAKRAMYRAAEIMSHWKDGPVRIVLSDVRFKCEARAIKEMGNGYVCRIIRTDAPTPKNEHRSENDLDRYLHDFEIRVNTGQFEDLYKQLDLLMENFNAV